MKFTYPSQRPKIPSLSHYGSCMHSLGGFFFTCVDFCKDKGAGNYADPDNCYGFIMCDVAGNAQEMDCPAGLAFNPSLLVCDWPENVECEAGSGELS